ncbi:MAG: hypothetical protein HQL31_07465 [Planctomycetes bacterium]|nr:hypothetical protein [Planctomycetota bacterium]
MVFEESFEVEASREKVWDFFSNPQDSLRCLSEVISISEVEPGVFDLVSKVRMGLLSFKIFSRTTFTQNCESWELHMRTQGHDRLRMGSFNQESLTCLKELDGGGTEVFCRMEVDFSGTLAKLGEGLIRKSSQEMSSSFAKHVKQILEDRG